MSSQRLHDKLIAEAAKSVLGPLGFQRKGRSRLWFADHDWWLAVVEFQPSGWDRGAYLNVAAKWLWRGDDVWSFDFSFHAAARAAGFVGFENEVQFREQVCGLAQTAAAEAQRLTEALPSIRAAAEQLRARAMNRGNGWDLYHAGVAAFLAGRSEEARRYFSELSVPKPDDYPGAVWLHELRATAGAYAELCLDRERFLALLTEQLHRSRSSLRLPSRPRGIPASSLYAV
jgi:hypothetical protein